MADDCCMHNSSKCWQEYKSWRHHANVMTELLPFTERGEANYSLKSPVSLLSGFAFF